MMNVNPSPVQMGRDNVPRAVEEALRYAGIDGSRLTIELTESALISDPDKTRQLLGALQAMNVTVAMDDFGTGFSNLASLQSLPIDILKIDRSFVTDMMGDKDKIAIVRAIISLAGALGMQTTAEGIEQAEMAEALAGLGCHYGQGYYFAKPLPPLEAYRFWIDRSSATII
jgi:EAL domain-containing protein (putative c-di-GMP-specific phosphodiesterase class I)